MKTLQDIKLILSDNRNHLFSEYPLKSLAIFGSYSRKEQTETSDIDILVDYNDNIGIRFIDLADEIEELLGQKIDLVSVKGIKEKYLQTIKPDLIYV